MQEAWVWASGFGMGIAFTIFIGWVVAWYGRSAAKKKVTHIATTISEITPTFTGQNYTLTHSDKRIYVTFAAPYGYKYVDTEENALVVTLPGVMLAEETV